MFGAATEKARLRRFSEVLGTDSPSEGYDLSYLGMVEQSRRLAK